MDDKKRRWLALGLVIFLALAFLLMSFSAFLVARRYAQLREDYGKKLEEYAQLELERQKLQEQNAAQAEQLEQLSARLEMMQTELESLQLRISELEPRANAYDEVSQLYSTLQNDYSVLEDDYRILQAKYNQLAENPSVNYAMLWELVKQQLPGIVCFGDSLTGGNSGGVGEGNRWSYPQELRTLVQSNVFSYIPVEFRSRGGASSAEILEYARRYVPYYDGFIYIIWMGTNGGWSTDGVEDPDVLIAQIDQMLSWQTDPQKRYLVCGLTARTNEQAAALDAAMQAKYGDRFVDLRSYLITDALADAGIAPTSVDLELMAMGRPPASLLKDSVHYNDTGYTLIGRYIYNRMVSLGYFSSVYAVTSRWL